MKNVSYWLVNRYIFYTDTKPKLQNLLDATEKLKNWYQLGLQLGISQIFLKTLHSKFEDDIDGAKKLVFKRWLSGKVTWDMLIDALNILGHVTMAKNIAQVYGIRKFHQLYCNIINCIHEFTINKKWNVRNSTGHKWDRCIKVYRKFCPAGYLNFLPVFVTVIVIVM